MPAIGSPVGVVALLPLFSAPGSEEGGRKRHNHPHDEFIGGAVATFTRSANSSGSTVLPSPCPASHDPRAGHGHADGII